MNPITLIGLSIVFFYSLTQILKFYGVGEDVYGIYILFYRTIGSVDDETSSVFLDAGFKVHNSS